MGNIKAKELYIYIFKTKVNFLTISLFVLCVVLVFFGMHWSAKVFDYCANDFYENTCFRDVEISYVYGIDDDLLEDLSKNSYIKCVEPTYISYQDFDKDGINYKAKFISITNNVDALTQVEGIFPTKRNEIAIEKKWAINHNIQIGTTISINEKHKFPLVRYIYDMDIDNICNNTNVSELNDQKFVVTALIESGPYMSVLDGMFGVDDKSLPIDCIIYGPNIIFNTNAYSGYSSLLVSFNGLDNYSVFSKIYSEKINFILNEIATILEKHKNDRYRRLITNTNFIEQNLKLNIDDVENSILIYKQKLKEAEFDNNNSIDIANLNNKMMEFLSESNNIRIMYDRYKNSIENLKEYSYSVKTIKYNSSYALVLSSIEVINSSKYSTSIVFMVVGILVCFCSISRLIYEDSVLIGTKKAFGYSTKMIINFYILYVLLACVFGILTGGVLARFLIEPIILIKACSHYVFDNLIWEFSIKELIILGIVIVSIQIFTVVFACQSMLKNSVINLLKGNTNKNISIHFYDNLYIFKKSSILTKMIINNFFIDKRRVIATIVTITGCVTLLVSSLSLRNFTTETFFVQYDKVFDFDTMIYIKKDTISVQNKLDSIGVNYAEIFKTGVYISAPNDKMLASSLFVFKDDKFEKFIHLYENNDNKYLNNGLWSSISYKNFFDAKIGDIMLFEDNFGKNYSIPIEGFFNYYLIQNQLYMKKELFENEFGENYETNVLILNTKDINKNVLNDILKTDENFNLLVDYYKDTKIIFDRFCSNLDILSNIYIGVAIFLILFGLLNLFFVFIEEYRYQFINLMINGYSNNSVKKFVYLDNVFLTIISILLGIYLGANIENITIKICQQENTFFLTGYNKDAIIFSVFLTIVLVVVMSLISLHTVENFKYSDINRANKK